MRFLKFSLIAGFLLYGSLCFAEETTIYTSVGPDNYQNEVLAPASPVLVFFYAEWCPYSGSLIPVYSQIEKAYTEKIKFCRFQLGDEYKDFDSAQGKARWVALKNNYGIETIPCIIMLDGGKEIDRMSGRPEKDLVDSYRGLLALWIDSNLLNPAAAPFRFGGTLLLQLKEPGK